MWEIISVRLEGFLTLRSPCIRCEVRLVQKTLISHLSPSVRVRLRVEDTGWEVCGKLYGEGNPEHEDDNRVTTWHLNYNLMS